MGEKREKVQEDKRPMIRVNLKKEQNNVRSEKDGNKRMVTDMKFKKAFRTNCRV